MRNTCTTKAYKAFYDNVLSKQHNHPELIGRWGDDPGRFETQIMCQKAGIKLDNGKFEQDGEIFGPHRWPYDPAGQPNYSDPPIPYVVETRMKCIGTTWWDWKNQKTIGLGYDFDSIIGHAKGVGVSDQELAKLDGIEVPWLEVIRSTRGAGRHIYIWFDENDAPTTVNHTEHAAIARAFIPLIAKHTDLDIEANVDVCGGVMWIHHENANAENHGYAQVKPATQTMTAAHVPPNWRDNLEVVSGSRARVRVQGWTADGTPADDDDILDEMTQAVAKVPLDEQHLKVLEDLESTGHSSLWVSDHHLWQGHTAGVKAVFDDWAERGHPMKGLFDTNSPDSDPGKPNLFMRPRPNGAWDVYRFGEGTDEHPMWDKQGKWTHTTLNYPATLRQICVACDGYEGPEEKQGYLFETVDDLKRALKILKSDVPVPEKSVDRGLSLYTNDRGKVVMVIEKKRNDNKSDFPRFVKTPRGWERWLDGAIDTSDIEVKDQAIWSDLDEKIRALKTESNSGAQFDSWVMRDDNDQWTTHPRDNISSFLAKEGFNKPAPILGGAVFKSWLLTNEPFKPEYPGGRQWNRNAAQLTFTPAELGEGESPVHPTWDRVMNHCGVELNDYIPDLPWCKDWGIVTGGDYMTAWVACMLQNPHGKLPYLFMYGPQNSGKSSFYEALEILMTKGSVERADKALTSDQGYNGELEGVVLAVIDEVDISKAGSTAYNRIKDWVTGLSFCLHAKYGQPRTVPNTLHFVQLSNTRRAVPVLPDDTRITAMNVPSLEEEIPKDQLFDLLRQEASHFMYTLLNYERQKATGRMMLPVIETQGKHDAAADNVDELEQFIAERCYEIPGAATRFSDFVKAFQTSLEVFQQGEWKERMIRLVVSEKLMYGTSRKHNQAIIGNLSLDPDIQPSTPFVKDGRFLMREDDLT